MENFFTFNLLNFFSLTILLLLFVHAIYYFKSDQEIIWKKVLVVAVVSQTLDILCWYISTFSGSLAITLSYILNILLFASATLLAAKLALFFESVISYRTKRYKSYKSFFNYLVLLNFVLLCLNIPFGFFFSIDVNNVYTRESLYHIMTILMLLPLIIISIKIIFKYFKNFNQILKDNKTLIIFITINLVVIGALIFIQGNQDVKVTAIYPFITISIIFLHLLLTSKAMNTDYLTLIQNRMGLNSYFSQLPKTLNHYLAILFFDLDKLKTINDAYGHKEGDIALKEFAKILINETKNKDVVARVGGDEFIIVLIVNNLEEIDIMIKSIIKEANDYNSKSQKIKIEFSYGTSISEPNTPFNIDELIEIADKRMYEQKQTKNNAKV